MKDTLSNIVYFLLARTYNTIPDERKIPAWFVLAKNITEIYQMM